MKRCSLSAIALAAVACAMACSARAAFVSDRLGPIEPYTGLYSDPSQSGSGLSVDVGPGGMLFMTFGTYDPEGNQENLITQPTYVPTSEAERASTGIIGRASGTFYKTTGGQCPGCAYRAPTITPTTLTANFVWTSPRHVTMTFGSSTYHFAAGNYESKDDEEFLPGTWIVNFNSDKRSFLPNETTLDAVLSVMRIVPASFTAAQLTLDPKSPTDIVLPPATAHLYTLQCAGTQSQTIGVNRAGCDLLGLMIAGLENDLSAVFLQLIVPIPVFALLWYDPVTQTAGIDMYEPRGDGTNVIGPANYHADLYIAPNRLQAHVIVQGQPVDPVFHDGDIPFSLTFTRVPAVTVRDCADYVTNPDPQATAACQP